MATKVHTRSISLPARSHPTTNKIELELNRLRTWEASSTSTSGSIFIGLSGLEDLYNSLDDLLNLGSIQEVLSKHQHEKCLDGVLNGPLKLLDTCEITRDLLFRFKEQIRALESALRRRKGDSSMEHDVNNYTCFRNKMKKEAKKLILTVLKQMDNKLVEPAFLNQDQHFSTVTRVLREVNSINLCIFKSLLLFLSAPVSKPRQSKWSLVSKLVLKGAVAHEEKQEQMNELERVDAALSEGLNCEKMHKGLEALEMSIEDLESSLECVFRRLIKTRASILNILSQ